MDVNRIRDLVGEAMGSEQEQYIKKLLTIITDKDQELKSLTHENSQLRNRYQTVTKDLQRERDRFLDCQSKCRQLDQTSDEYKRKIDYLENQLNEKEVLLDEQLTTMQEYHKLEKVREGAAKLLELKKSDDASRQQLERQLSDAQAMIHQQKEAYKNALDEQQKANERIIEERVVVVKEKYEAELARIRDLSVKEIKEMSKELDILHNAYNAAVSQQDEAARAVVREVAYRDVANDVNVPYEPRHQHQHSGDQSKYLGMSDIQNLSREETKSKIADMLHQVTSSKILQSSASGRKSRTSPGRTSPRDYLRDRATKGSENFGPPASRSPPSPKASSIPLTSHQMSHWKQENAPSSPTRSANASSGKARDRTPPRNRPSPRRISPPRSPDQRGSNLLRSTLSDLRSRRDLMDKDVRALLAVREKGWKY